MKMNVYTIPEVYLYPHSGKNDQQKTIASYLISIYQDKCNLLREAEQLVVNKIWKPEYNAMIYEFKDKSGIIFYDHKKRMGESYEHILPRS